MKNLEEDYANRYNPIGYDVLSRGRDRLEENNKAYRVWMDQLNTKAQGTRWTYLHWFTKFLERYEITDAEALYRMKVEDLKSEDTRDRLRVEAMAKTMMFEGIKVGYKPKTVAHLAKSLKSFFDAQNIPFSMKPADYPKGESIGRRLILKEQITAVYDNVGTENKLRNRGLIMVLKDSGLRISDAAALTVESYRTAQTVTNTAGEPFKVFDTIQTIKCKVNANVHLGPEAVKAVDAYLALRGNVPGDSPIFVDRDGKTMSSPALSEQFRRLCNHVKGVKRLGAHSFRKFHTTQLESAGLSENWIKKLQGKSLDQSTGSYSHPEETGDLTRQYIEKYDRLRLFGEADISQIRHELEASKAGQNSRVAEIEAKLALQDETNRLNSEKQGATIASLQSELNSLRAEMVEIVKDALDRILETS